MRCPITPQLVGDQLPGWSFLMLQYLTKEALRLPTVAPRLSKNIYHVAVLIHGAPQILSLTVNRDEESSRPGESHPEALTEPCVNLSAHTALASHSPTTSR